MHTGRVAHEANLPEGGKVVGVSDIKAAGEMYTDALGMQEHTQPVALSTEEVYQVMSEYVSGAKNAVEAGFDGVELHRCQRIFAGAVSEPECKQQNRRIWRKC